MDPMRAPGDPVTHVISGRASKSGMRSLGPVERRGSGVLARDGSRSTRSGALRQAAGSLAATSVLRDPEADDASDDGFAGGGMGGSREGKSDGGSRPGTGVGFSLPDTLAGSKLSPGPQGAAASFHAESRVSSRDPRAPSEGPSIVDLQRRAEAARGKEERVRARHLAGLQPHERLSLQREERARALWERRQRQWASIRQSQARRSGRDEGKTVLARADEWREVVEEYDLLEKAAPSDERHGPEGWAMGLRGGGERFVLVGNIFNGLYVPVKDKGAPLAEVVRRPRRLGGARATTTLPSTKSQMTSSTQAIGQLAYGKNWRDAPSLRRRRRELKGRIRTLRPHDVPVDATDALCVVGEDLLEWARRSHAPPRAGGAGGVGFDGFDDDFAGDDGAGTGAGGYAGAGFRPDAGAARARPPTSDLRFREYSAFQADHPGRERTMQPSPPLADEPGARGDVGAVAGRDSAAGRARLASRVSWRHDDDNAGGGGGGGGVSGSGARSPGSAGGDGFDRTESGSVLAPTPSDLQGRASPLQLGLGDVESFRLPSASADRRRRGVSPSPPPPAADAPIPGPHLLVVVRRDAVVTGEPGGSAPLEAGVRRAARADAAHPAVSPGEVITVGAPSGSAADAARGWPRVTMEAAAAAAGHAEARLGLRNTGSTVLYFDLAPLSRADTAPAGVAEAPRFQIVPTSGSILPGEELPATVLFRSAQAGVFREAWALRTRPGANGAALVRIALRGVATEADEAGPKRRAIEERLQRRMAERAAELEAEREEEAARPPTPPPSGEALWALRRQRWERHCPGLVFTEQRWDALEAAGAEAAAIAASAGACLEAEAAERDAAAQAAWKARFKAAKAAAEAAAAAEASSKGGKASKGGGASHATADAAAGEDDEDEAEAAAAAAAKRAAEEEALAAETEEAATATALLARAEQAEAEAEAELAEARERGEAARAAFQWDGKLSTLSALLAPLAASRASPAEMRARAARRAAVKAVEAAVRAHEAAAGGAKKGKGAAAAKGKGSAKAKSSAKGKGKDSGGGAADDGSARQGLPRRPAPVTRHALSRTRARELRSVLAREVSNAALPVPEESDLWDLGRAVLCQAAEAVPVAVAAARRLAGLPLRAELGEWIPLTAKAEADSAAAAAAAGLAGASGAPRSRAGAGAGESEEDDEDADGDEDADAERVQALGVIRLALGAGGARGLRVLERRDARLAAAEARRRRKAEARGVDPESLPLPDMDEDDDDDDDEDEEEEDGDEEDDDDDDEVPGGDVGQMDAARSGMAAAAAAAAAAVAELRRRRAAAKAEEERLAEAGGAKGKGSAKGKSSAKGKGGAGKGGVGSEEEEAQAEAARLVAEAAEEDAEAAKAVAAVMESLASSDSAPRALGVAWAAVVGGVDLAATDAAWAEATGAGLAGVPSVIAAAVGPLRRLANVARRRGVRVYAPVDLVTAPRAFAPVAPALADYDEEEEADAVEERWGLGLSGQAVGEEEEEAEGVDSDDDEGWEELRDKRLARRVARRRLVGAMREAAASRAEAAAAAATEWGEVRAAAEAEAEAEAEAAAESEGEGAGGGQGRLPTAAAARALLLAATGGKGTIEVGAGAAPFEAAQTLSVEPVDTVAAWEGLGRRAEALVATSAAAAEGAAGGDAAAAAGAGSGPAGGLGAAPPRVGGVALDIGPVSRERASEAIEGAGTVVWAGGAMGVCECDELAEGTREVAGAVVAAARAGANVVVAGGSAVAAAVDAGLEASLRSPVAGGVDADVVLVRHAASVRAMLEGDALACRPVARLSRLPA
ncbi:hypothetical protein FNF28_02327 [Cafeteria roenbergensis]|uniref:phosphoglycerate kinase n=1 Tax=Cafeteria roenbergensis TaxID=33653 RepID=A0A5A8DUA2_CAFRO|nr:hypothetical protein FNF28_02327 [Cafeteria roenbergensis]